MPNALPKESIKTSVIRAVLPGVNIWWNSSLHANRIQKIKLYLKDFWRLLVFKTKNVSIPKVK